MDLDDLIITYFCLIDTGLQVALGGKRLRERGPSPTLADSEVRLLADRGNYSGEGSIERVFHKGA